LCLTLPLIALKLITARRPISSTMLNVDDAPNNLKRYLSMWLRLRLV